MKKIILFAFVLTINIGSAFSQQWENYFQFGVGTGYLNDANIRDAPFLLFEYGKTYKWCDFVGALESANQNDKYTKENKNYMSLVLKTKFDIVRMFTENSRHSFKLGTGVGIGTTNFYQWYNRPDSKSQSYSPACYMLYSVMASYEYGIADKTWLGVFFNNYTSDSFFGMHYGGLSIRCDF